MQFSQPDLVAKIMERICASGDFSVLEYVWRTYLPHIDPHHGDGLLESVEAGLLYAPLVDLRTILSELSPALAASA